MLGFVVRRLRGRLPLAAAVLLAVLITTSVLTALVAFNSSVGEAGLRQALQGPGHARTTVAVTGEHGLDQRTKDEEALASYRQKLFGDLPVRTDSMARSRSYSLPGADGAANGSAPAGQNPAGQAPGPTDLTILADLDRGRVQLLAGAWPGAATGPVRSAAPDVAVPQSLLRRLALTEQALPAEVRLVDRSDSTPLTVRITGVYRATDPSAPYWRIDPVGGHEIEVGGFTTYGPMMVDQSAFTTAGLVQGGRGWSLDADFSGTDRAGAQAVGDRAQRLSNELRSTASLGAKTELPDIMSELSDSMVVARSTLLIGALQLAVLAAAALLLVVHLIAARQESENEMLAARGASAVRLGSFTALESLLLALPAAVFAPLLTPFLVRALAGLGSSHRVALDTGVSWSLWPVAVVCAFACILLATVPSVVRGVGAALRRRAGRRQAVVSGIARNGGDLAVLALAALAYQQLDQYGGGLSPDAGGRLDVDLLLVATPTLALCAGTLVVLRLLPLVARLGARAAARGRGLGPAMVGWQLARRPGRGTGPVLLLVMAVATGVLALGQHATWTASQRDQAVFATAGGLRISGSHNSPMGQGGRYGSLPGGDRLVPVVRDEQPLPGGAAQLLAVDATAFAEHVPVRSDLIGGRTGAEVFGPLAAPATPGIPLPGRPLRIDADVSLVQDEQVPRWRSPVHPEVRLLLRDRFGLVHKVAFGELPLTGQVRASIRLGALVDAPVGSVAAPLTVVGATVGFGDRSGGEVAVRNLAVSETADGPSTAVPVPSGAAWSLKPPPSRSGTDSTPVAALASEAAAADNLFTVRYRPAGGIGDSVRAVLSPAGSIGTALPATADAVATRDYLKAVGASVGDTVQVPFSGVVVPVKVTGVAEAVPVAGRRALLMDLGTVARMLAAQDRGMPPRTEWWLPTEVVRRQKSGFPFGQSPEYLEAVREA
ncbi:hypothetical protein ABZW03_34710, partial [Kitasatospora sp. NPDC004799]|uniref:hypothetical protein n=1 Tax=Kitasatospora sp. NPDC004799 TaxID=3154460 RepID=UPI0033B6E2C5